MTTTLDPQPEAWCRLFLSGSVTHRLRFTGRRGTVAEVGESVNNYDYDYTPVLQNTRRSKIPELRTLA